MAVEIPKAAKLQTTKYADFKGVDYTNDPSNVWYRRSPNGKNMLPDLDGKPFKRKGWDVMVDEIDFRYEDYSYSPSAIELAPDRLYYFELGGYDYMVIFNSRGLFTLTPDNNPNVPPTPEARRLLLDNGYILVYHDGYLNLNNSYVRSSSHTIGGETVTLPVKFDSNRAFFFEGGGEAGFYVFLANDNKMVRLTNDSYNFCEVDPYIPTVLEMCDHNGVGSLAEPVNMMTSKRRITYANDEQLEEVKYYLPEGETFYSVESVELRNADGSWTATTSYGGGTVGTNYISFTTQPPAPLEGQENIRVTYTPTGTEWVVNTQSAQSSTSRRVRVIRYEKYRQRCVEPNDLGPGQTTIDQNILKERRWDRPSEVFDAINMVPGSSVFSRFYNNTWTVLDSSYYTYSYSAYDNTVSFAGTEQWYAGAAGQTEPASITATEWARGTGANGESRDYYYRDYSTTTYITYVVKHQYQQYYAVDSSQTGTVSVSEARNAFWGCTKALIFGNGIINQVFLTATSEPNYATRVWYSGATKPTYFADTNYIEVGATDKPVMGLMKVGEYLGIVKGSDATDTSIYLGYPTSFDNITTYAVKQSISGIGAAAKGAFNTLNGEPLFLSNEGIMGIDVSNEERRLRNRSHYINKPLCNENDLQKAVSFVYDGMYWLAVNNHCYVLDGSQKNSWANEKTNYQYECYYLDNFPAQCFAKFNGDLWFSDYKGNICRYKNKNDENPYRDFYSTGSPDWVTSSAPVPSLLYPGCYEIGEEDITSWTSGSVLDIKKNDTVKYGELWYTIIKVNLEQHIHIAVEGVPIGATWSTIADDDGAVHYFKTLKKKGCVISLLPAGDSGVEVYMRKDENDPKYIGKTDASGHFLPYEYYTKRKMKKYKRLQFICENNNLDQSFGIDQIIKTYELGNYSKNRSGNA